MRVSLWVVLTDISATLAERNISVAKGESLVIGFSSTVLRTLELGKEVDTSSISLSLYVSVKVSASGWDFLGNLFGIWGRGVQISHVYRLTFYWSSAPPLTMESNFCWELTKRETLSPWLKCGFTISILELRGGP